MINYKFILKLFYQITTYCLKFIYYTNFIRFLYDKNYKFLKKQNPEYPKIKNIEFLYYTNFIRFVYDKK